jgi:hypothetical protein
MMHLHLNMLPLVLLIVMVCSKFNPECYLAKLLDVY